MVPALCRLVLGVVALATLAAASPPVQAAPSLTDPAAVRAEVERVYDWAGYQRELPGDDRSITEPHRPPVNPRLNIDLGLLPVTILIGLAIVAVALVLMALRSGSWSWGAPLEQPPAPEGVPAETRQETLKARLDDADHSALAGDWAAAIHVLLLTSIELLRRRIGQVVPVAMTARELVGRARLEEQARTDFAALVSAAELCHFGGRPADRSLYDRCRVHYERLWGMPPEAAA